MWTQLAAELERAERELLAAEIGAGPRTARIAQLRVQARLVAFIAEGLERALFALVECGDKAAADDVRRRIVALAAEQREYRAAAAQLESAQCGALDAPRFAALRLQVAEAHDEHSLRDAANEVEQALARVGHSAGTLLWKAVERRAERLHVGGLERIAERARRHLHEMGPAAAAAAAEARLDRAQIAELLNSALDLMPRAPGMPRDELLDWIESIAGRLKALQERQDLALDKVEDADSRALHRAFGILTRLSKDHQPGFTPLLNSRERGGPWLAMATDADARIAARERGREGERRAARREQEREAVRLLWERAAAHDVREALDRLRAKVDQYDALAAAGGADDEEAAELRTAIRTQAAIALRASADEAAFVRVAALLDGHREIASNSRALRRLARHWQLDAGAEPDEDAALAFPEPGIDQEALDEATPADAPWPAEVLAARGAGAGERVLLVGGLSDDERCELLEEFFGWASVEWKESYRERQADFAALRERIAAGRFDRVIVLARFCGHDVSQRLGPACRTHGVAYSVHPRGVSIPAMAVMVYGARPFAA